MCIRDSARSLTMKDLEYLLFDYNEEALEDCYDYLFNEGPDNLSRDEQITKIKKKLTIDEWSIYHSSEDSEIQIINNIFNTTKWPIVDVSCANINGPRIRSTRFEKEKSSLYILVF